MKNIIKSLILVIMLTFLFVIFSYKHKYNYINSIVNIVGTSGEEEKSGVGFVYKNIKNTTYVLTNYHVISNMENINIYNSDKKFEAAILAYDEYSDIAILTFKNNLNILPLEISESNVKTNSKVYTYDLDSNKKITGKVVSTLEKVYVFNENINSSYTAIKTNIKANYGMSGSPLFYKGKVVGMISTMKIDGNYSFAINSSEILEIVNKLENNNLNRPVIGAKITDSDNTDLLNKYNITVTRKGAIIYEIKDGYPFSNAGLMVGDIILEIDGVKINNTKELQDKIYSYSSSDIITIKYYRDKYYETKVSLK